jgi:hypothetical protein
MRFTGGSVPVSLAATTWASRIRNGYKMSMNVNVSELSRIMNANLAYLQTKGVCRGAADIVSVRFEEARNIKDKMYTMDGTAPMPSLDFTNLYCREIIMSPFWLRTIIMEIIMLISSPAPWT